MHVKCTLNARKIHSKCASPLIWTLYAGIESAVGVHFTECFLQSKQSVVRLCFTCHAAPFPHHFPESLFSNPTPASLFGRPLCRFAQSARLQKPCHLGKSQCYSTIFFPSLSRIPLFESDSGLSFRPTWVVVNETSG